jgi:hypothetical protein
VEINEIFFLERKPIPISTTNFIIKAKGPFLKELQKLIFGDWT